MSPAPVLPPTSKPGLLGRLDIAQAIINTTSPGIDMINAWAPARDLTSSIYQWDRVGSSSTNNQVLDLTSWLVLTKDVTARVCYRSGPDRRSVWVEFNPSAGGALVGLAETLPMLNQAWDEIEALVDLPTRRPDVCISRLDLTVDFAPVADMNQLLAIANNIHVPHRSTKGYGSAGRMETVNIGWTKTLGFLTVYDKARESKLVEPTLRVEAKLRKQDTKRLGISTIGDLSEVRLSAAFHDMTVGYVNALQTKPLRSISGGSIKPQGKAEAIGALLLKERGVVLDYPPRREREHRRILGELQITHTDDVLTPPPRINGEPGLS